MTLNIPEQIKLLKALNILLLIVLLCTVYIVINDSLQTNETTKVMGKIRYLEEISDPANSSKGVWLKITLDNPKKAELTQIMLGADLANEKRVYFNFRSDNFTATYGNYTAQFYDRNQDGYVSSGDEFHIYGVALENADFYFYVSGYNGALRERI